MWRLRRVFRKHRPGTPRVTVRSTKRAAFNGWTGPDERRGKLRIKWDESPRPAPEARSRGCKRHKWSAGRRACFAKHAAPSQGANDDVAPFGAPLPHACEGGKEGRRPGAVKQPRRDGACLHLPAAARIAALAPEPGAVLSRHQGSCCSHVDHLMAVQPSGSAPSKNKAAPNRRRIIAACLGAFAALLLPRDGHAQAYPDRTISYIVPSSPGSSPDIVGRIMAEALAKILGQPVVVLNRAGAGGTIAAAAAAKAVPDGYTILQANTNHSFSQTLYKNLSYDHRERFQSGRTLCIGLLHRPGASQGGRQNAERADRQGQVSARKVELCVGRRGGCDVHRHRSAESAGRLDMVHVPYNGGGPALASILAGVTESTDRPIRPPSRSSMKESSSGSPSRRRSGFLTSRICRRSPKRCRATR